MTSLTLHNVEAPKEILLDRANFLVRDTWLKKECSCSSASHSVEPKIKSPRVEKPRGKSGNLPPNNSGRERNYNSRTFFSSNYTNSNFAEKRNLAKESAEKDSSYSKGKRSSKQANGPSAKASTSDKIWKGNPSEFTGPGKVKKGKKGSFHSLVLSLCFIGLIKGSELNVLTSIVAGLSLLLLPIGAETVV